MPTSPAVEVLAPTNLTPYTAIFHGRIQDDQGYDCMVRFQLSKNLATDKHPAQSPWLGPYHTDDIFDYNAIIEGFAGQWQTRVLLRYDSNEVYSNIIKFWLLIPTQIDRGPPFLLTYQTQNWLDSTLLWECDTDIPCHMTIFTRGAPWWKGRGWHSKRGTEMRHDLRFQTGTGTYSEQLEEGDTTHHTFAIEFTVPGSKRYWYGTATVDGKISVSATPIFYKSLGRAPVACTCLPSEEMHSNQIWRDKLAFYLRPRTTFDLWGIEIEIGTQKPNLFNTIWQFQLVTATPDNYPSEDVISTGKLHFRYGLVYQLYKYKIEMTRCELIQDHPYYLVITAHKWPNNVPQYPDPLNIYGLNRRVLSTGLCLVSYWVCYMSCHHLGFWNRTSYPHWRWWWQPLKIPKTLLQVLTSVLPTAYKGYLYDYTLEAEGGTYYYTWGIKYGCLPPGLELNPTTGRIQGTPTILGHWEMVFTVFDGIVTRTRTLFLDVIEL